MGLQSSEKTTWYDWNHENWIYFSINPSILQVYYKYCLIELLIIVNLLYFVNICLVLLSNMICCKIESNLMSIYLSDSRYKLAKSSIILVAHLLNQMLDQLKHSSQKWLPFNFASSLGLKFKTREEFFNILWNRFVHFCRKIAWPIREIFPTWFAYLKL